MAGIVNDIFQAYVVCNYKDAGMASVYWLRAPSWHEARLAALRIAKARSYLLGEGAYVEWVDARKPVWPAPNYPTLQYPIQALKKSTGVPFWSPPNSVHTGLNIIWRPQGHKGYWTRLWFVADDEFKDDEWVRRGLVVPKTPPVVSGSPATWSKDTLWRWALAEIASLTCLAVPLDDLPDGTHQWQTYDWLQICFGSIGSSTARPKYHRVSFEWADPLKPAHFSACGMAVGCVRHTYEAKCRPYVNGALNQIRFYYANDAARIFPMQNIFHPHYGHEDYKNTDGVGEKSGTPIVPWTAGWSWSSAPGLAPTGGPHAFMGENHAPFDESLPTPIFLRPPCDVPMTPQLKVEDDQQIFELLNTLQIDFDAEEYELSLRGPNNVLVKPTVVGMTTTVTVAGFTLTFERGKLTGKDYGLAHPGGAQAGGAAAYFGGFPLASAGGAAPGGAAAYFGGFPLASAGGSAPGGGASYFSGFPLTTAGGSAPGGGAVYSWGLDLGSSGGSSAGGSAAYFPGFPLDTAGGSAPGGAAVYTQGFDLASPGGAEAGGAAAYTQGFDLASAGGAEAGGAAAYEDNPGGPPPPPTPGTSCADAPTLGLDTDYSYDGDTTAHWFAIPTSSGSNNIHVIITGTSPGIDYQLWSDCPATTLVFQNGVGGGSVCRQWSGNGSLNYLRIGPQPHESGFGDYAIRFEAGPCP